MTGGRRNRTALHYASIANNVAIAKVLLKFSVDQEIVDATGYTALNLSNGGEVCRLLHKVIFCCRLGAVLSTGWGGVLHLYFIPKPLVVLYLVSLRWRGNLPFRKRSLPLITVVAISARIGLWAELENDFPISYSRSIIAYCSSQFDCWKL